MVPPVPFLLLFSPFSLPPHAHPLLSFLVLSPLLSSSPISSPPLSLSLSSPLPLPFFSRFAFFYFSFVLSDSPVCTASLLYLPYHLPIFLKSLRNLGVSFFFRGFVQMLLINPYTTGARLKTIWASAFHEFLFL